MNLLLKNKGSEIILMLKETSVDFSLRCDDLPTIEEKHWPLHTLLLTRCHYHTISKETVTYVFNTEDIPMERLRAQIGETGYEIRELQMKG